MKMTIKDRHTACLILDKVYDFFVRETLHTNKVLPEKLFTHLTYIEEEEDIVTHFYIHIFKGYISGKSILSLSNAYYQLEQHNDSIYIYQSILLSRSQMMM
jgi:hypothetical protein